MIDWLSLFQNFGYPALITGVLLYIIVYKLERITTEVQEMKEELIKLSSSISEYRGDVRDVMAVVDRRFLTNSRKEP